jgi:hypothetical protein
MGSIAMSVMVLGLGVPAAEPGTTAVVTKSPVPPPEASKQITVPNGFQVTLCAAEPDVVQPIAMTLDHRGRLWVVENYSYPVWLGGPHGKDRILIFEDADGDGRFDRRTVFADGGTNAGPTIPASSWVSAGSGSAPRPT